MNTLLVSVSLTKKNTPDCAKLVTNPSQRKNILDFFPIKVAVGKKIIVLIIGWKLDVVVV